MPITIIDVTTFRKLAKTHLVLDVRSPSEYAHAHIPGATSFPLFSDEERKAIGTLYKQTSREAAVFEGLKYFGHHLETRAKAAMQLIQSSPNPHAVIVHCWRGGMRSGAMAWLLNLFGLTVYQLAGGYKAWRKDALTILEKPYAFKLLNGFTGSNKTGVIKELAKAGEAAIDLEELAGHKGSAFGNLDLIPQPSQEQFENTLAEALFYWSNLKPNVPIWVEAENQRIGLRNIPTSVFIQMKASKQHFIIIPFETRLQFIETQYGKHSTESLINAIVRIQKKLGGKDAKACIHHLLEGDIRACFEILLHYYDRLYLRHAGDWNDPNNPNIHHSQTTDALHNLKKLNLHE